MSPQWNHQMLLVLILVAPMLLAEEQPVAVASLWTTSTTEESYYSSVSVTINEKDAIACSIVTAASPTINCVNLTTGDLLWTDPLKPQCSKAQFIVSTRDRVVVACDEGAKIYPFGTSHAFGAWLPWPLQLHAIAPSNNQFLRVHEDYVLITVESATAVGGLVLVDAHNAVLLSPTPFLCKNANSRLNVVYGIFDAGTVATMCSEEGFFALEVPSLAPKWFASLAGLNAVAGLQFNFTDFIDHQHDFNDLVLAAYVAYVDADNLTIGTLNPFNLSMTTTVFPLPIALRGCLVVNQLVVLVDGTIVVQSSCGIVCVRNNTIVSQLPLYEMGLTVFPLFRGDALLVATDEVLVMFNASTGTIEWLQFVTFTWPTFGIAPVFRGFYDYGDSTPSQGPPTPVLFTLVDMGPSTALWMFDMDTGALIGHFTFPYVVRNAPIFVHRIATDPSMRHEHGILLQGMNGVLSMLSTTVGWSRSITPVDVQDGVAFGSLSGAIAVDRTGEVQWSVPTAQGNSRGSFIFANNYFVQLHDGGGMTVLDSYTGEFVTTLLVPSECQSIDGSIGTITADRLTRTSDDRTAYFTAGTYCLYRLDASLTLTFGKIGTLLDLAPILDEDNRIAFIIQDSNVVAVDMDTMVLLWSFAMIAPITDVVPSSVMGDPSTYGKGLHKLLYVIAGPVLFCLDMAKSPVTIVWNKFVDPAQAPPVVYDNAMFLGTKSGMARIDLHIEAVGNVQWTTDSPDVSLTSLMFAPVVLPKGELVVPANGGIAALSTATGDVLWTVKGSQTIYCSSAVFDVKRYLVLVACLQQLVVIDALTGVEVLRVESGTIGTQVKLSDDVLYLVDSTSVFAYVLPVTLLSYNKGKIPPIRPTEPPAPQTLPPGFTPQPPFTFPPSATVPTSIGDPLMARRLDMSLVNNYAITGMESQDVFVVALTPSIRGCTPRGYNATTFEQLWVGLTDLFSCSCNVEMQVLGNTTMAPTVVVMACGIAVGLDMKSGAKKWTHSTANVVALNQYRAAGEDQLLLVSATAIEGVSAESGVKRWSVKYTANLGVTTTVLYNAMFHDEKDTRAVLMVLNESSLVVVNISESFIGSQRVVFTDTGRCDYSSALLSMYPAWGIFPNVQFGGSMFLACRATTASPDVTVFELTSTSGFAMAPWTTLTLGGVLLNTIAHPIAKSVFVSTENGAAKYSLVTKERQWLVTPTAWGLAHLQAPLGVFEESVYLVASDGNAGYFVALDFNAGTYRYNLTASAEATSRDMIVTSPTKGRLVVGVANSIHYILNDTGTDLWYYSEPSAFHSLIPFFPAQAYGTANGDGVALLALARGAATSMAAVFYCETTYAKPEVWTFPTPALPPLGLDGVSMTVVFSRAALYGITLDGTNQWSTVVAPESSLVLGTAMGVFSSLLRVVVVTPHNLLIVDGNDGRIMITMTHAKECVGDAFNIVVPISSDDNYFYYASTYCFFRISPISNSVEAAITTLSLSSMPTAVFSRDRHMAAVGSTQSAILGISLGGAAMPAWVAPFASNEAVQFLLPAAAGASGSNPPSEDFVVAITECNVRGFRFSDGVEVLNMKVCSMPTDNIITEAVVTVNGGLIAFVKNVGLFRYRLDVTDPGMVWTYPMNGKDQASILALSSANVVVVLSQEGLMGLSAITGDLLWAIDGGVLYPSCTSGQLFEVPSVVGVLSQCDGIVRDAISGLPVTVAAGTTESWMTVLSSRVLRRKFDIHTGDNVIANTPLFTILPAPKHAPPTPPTPSYPSIPAGFTPTTAAPTDKPQPLTPPLQYSAPRIWSVPGDTDLFTSYAVTGVMNGVEVVVLLKAHDRPVNPVVISVYHSVTGSLVAERVIDITPSTKLWMGLLATNVVGVAIDTVMHVIDISNQQLTDVFTFNLDRQVMLPTHPRDTVTRIVYVVYYGAACIPEYDGTSSTVQCVVIDRSKSSYTQTIARHECPGRMEFPILQPSSDNVLIVCSPFNPQQGAYAASLSLASGNTLWTTTLRESAGAPRATSQYIAIPNYNMNDNATTLTCLELSNGDKVAELPTVFLSGGAGPVDYDLAEVGGETYWVATAPTLTASYHIPSTVKVWSDSDPQWNRQALVVTYDPQLNEELAYIGEYSVGSVGAYNPATGQLVWVTSAIVEDGAWTRALIVVNGGNGLFDPTAHGSNYIDLQLRKATWFYYQYAPPIMEPYFYTVTGGEACLMVLGSNIVSLLVGDMGYSLDVEGVVDVYDNTNVSYLIAWVDGRFEQRVTLSGAPQWNVQLVADSSAGGFRPTVFLRTSPFGADHVLVTPDSTHYAVLAWGTGEVRTQSATPACGLNLPNNDVFSVADKTRRLLYTTAQNPCVYIVNGYSGYVNAVSTGHNTALLPYIALTDACIIVINAGGDIMCVDRTLSESAAAAHPNTEVGSSILWSHQLGAISDVDSVQVVAVGSYLALSHGPYVYLFDANGKLAWQKYVGDNCALATVNGLVAAVSGFGFFIVNSNPLLPPELRLIVDMPAHMLLFEDFAPNTIFTPPVVTLGGNIFFGLGSMIFAFSLDTMQMAYSGNVREPCSSLTYSSGSSLTSQLVVSHCGTVDLRDATTGAVVLSLVESDSLNFKPIIDGKINAVMYMTDEQFVQVLRLPVGYLLSRLSRPTTPMPTIPAPTGTLDPTFQPQGVFTGVATLPAGVTNPSLGCALVVEAAFENFGLCVIALQKWMYPNSVPVAVDCTEAATRLSACSAAWIAATRATCVGSYIMLNRYLQTLNGTNVFGFCGHPERCTESTASQAMCTAMNAAQPYEHGQTLWPSFTFPPPANAIPQFTLEPPSTVAPTSYAFLCYVDATKASPIPFDLEDLVRIFLVMDATPVLFYSDITTHNFTFSFADMDEEQRYGPQLADGINFNAANVAAALHVTSIQFIQRANPIPPPSAPATKGVGAGEVIAILLAIVAAIGFIALGIRYREDVCGGRWRRKALPEVMVQDTREAPSGVGELKPLIN